MANQWFFSWGEHNFGPFSADELKNLAASGRLQPSDLVWKDGMTAGIVAGRVKNLFQVVVSPMGTFIAAAPEAEVASLPASEPVQAETQEAIAPRTIVEPSLVEPEQPQSEAEAAAEVEELPAAPRAKPRPAPRERVPQSTAKAVRGVVIIGQDGKSVSFRKKCPKCGQEDNSRTSMPIRNGLMRVSFYCSGCRKSQSAEIQGLVK